MVGIIDIGSNTIRLVVYNKTRRVFNNGLNSDLISDTKNGILSDEGIEKLIQAVIFLKEKAGNIPVYAFGTYAMRVLINKDIVKQKVFEKTGVSIDILSGKQEAEYDFYGLLGAIDKNESGIGIDLGGGSAQILIFENGEIKHTNSYPLGCKKIKNKFTENNPVNEEERDRISNYIRFNLQNLSGYSTEKIYVMGGTAKTTAKLYKIITDENSDIIDCNKLEDIIAFLNETPERTLRKILKSRYDTIIVGVIVINEIAKVFSAQKIHIKRCGVRDGYIYKNCNE